MVENGVKPSRKRSPEGAIATDVKTEADRQREADLVAARQEVASIYAKNRSRVVEDHDREAVEKYNRLVVEQGQEELADRLRFEHDQSRRNVLVLDYIFEKQKELGQEIDKITENSRFYKFRKAFSDFMNRGGRVSRFVKKRTLSLLSAVTGAAIGGVAGAAAGVGMSETLQSFADHRFASVTRRSQTVAMKRVKEVAQETRASISQKEDIGTVLQIAQGVSVQNTEKCIERDRQDYYGALGKSARKGLISGGLVFVVGSAVQWAAPDIIPNAHAVDTDGSGSHSMPDMPDSSAGGYGVPEMPDSDGYGHPEMPDSNDTHGVPDMPLSDSHSTPDIPNQPTANDGYSTPEIPSSSDGHSTPDMPDSDDGHSTPDMPPGAETDPTGQFEFCYGEAPEHLLEDVVKEQLGRSLTDDQAYRLINHLMHETEGNIFEGVRTEWNVPGKDVWIMDPGGDTSGLTEEAKVAARKWLMQDLTGLPSTGV